MSGFTDFQILRERPDFGEMLANDVGKARLASDRRPKRPRTTAARASPPPAGQDWQKLVSANKKNNKTAPLVNLDDDSD